MTSPNLTKALKELAKQARKAQRRVNVASGITKDDLNSSLAIIKAIEGMKEINQGDKGDTPRKGVDYFTPSEINAFLRQATPVKGKDYFTEKEIKRFLQASTPKDGEKGDKGDKGDPGKDGKAPTESAIRKLIKPFLKKHEEKHELIHDPKMLGEYEIGEVKEGDILQVQGKKLVGIGLPTQTSVPYYARGSATTSQNIIKDISSDYTIDKLDDIIHVDASGGNITITIPESAGSEGSAHFIKRVDSTDTNDVIFAMTGDDTIDNETLHKLVNYGDGADIYSHNSAWFLRKA